MEPTLFQKVTCTLRVRKVLALKSMHKVFETRIESQWIRKTDSSTGVKLVPMQTMILWTSRALEATMKSTKPERQVTLAGHTLLEIILPTPNLTTKQVR